MSVKTTVAPGSSFTVPTGITQTRVTAKGAAGASPVVAKSGRGAIIQALLTVTPSQSLSVSAVAGGPGGTTSAPGTYSDKYGFAGGSGVNVAGQVIAGGGGGAGASLSPNGSGYSPAGDGGDAGVAFGIDGADGYSDGTSTAGHGGKGAGGASGGAGGTGTAAGAAGTNYSGGGAGGSGANGANGTSGTSAYPGSGGGGGGGGGYAGGGGGGGGTGKGSTGPGGGGGSSSGGDLIGFNTSTVASADFEVAGAPKAPTPISPTGNAYVDRTAAIVLSVQHNPDTPGDALDVQTDCEIRYRKVESPAGAWTTASSLGTATATSIAASSLEAAQYEWQARTKADGAAGDANGVWGAWTDSQYFRAATPPATPTQTAPTSGSTVDSVTFASSWTAPGQVEYQTQLIGDLAGVADPSVVYSSKAGTTASMDTLTAGTNNVDAHVRTRIRTTAGGLWSAWADVKVSVAWAGPPKPAVILAAGPSGIYVTVTSPAATGVEPTADRIWIYVHEGSVTERRAILDPGEAWIYETPPSGVDVGIEAVAIYTPTGVQTSSGVTW